MTLVETLSFLELSNFGAFLLAFGGALVSMNVVERIILKVKKHSETNLARAVGRWSGIS